jgi:serine phosphatase RsbU (regulator of sigma subunit)
MSPQDICQLNRLEIQPNDVLTIYTDGVTEVENRAREEFGIEQLVRVIQDNAALPADHVNRANV